MIIKLEEIPAVLLKFPKTFIDSFVEMIQWTDQGEVIVRGHIIKWTYLLDYNYRIIIQRTPNYDEARV